MQVAAILLAAGQSRRMGALKPLLPFGNQTVIEACITNLRAAGIDQIVVVVGYRADKVMKHLRSANVSFALNSDPDSEMGISIARGVERVSEDAKAILIALVDHPAVATETIESIIDEWRRGARLVQPEYNGRGGHPVLIDLTCRDELSQLDPAKGLRGFFEKHREEVRRLPVDSRYVARDLDTWEDYVRLHQEVFGRLPDAHRGDIS